MNGRDSILVFKLYSETADWVSKYPTPTQS